METIEPTGREFVVASYNVHGFVSRHGRFDPDATLGVAASLDADVLALQEVHRIPQSIRALEAFAEEAEYELILGPTLQRGEGDFGNAVLSRLPITGFERRDLSVEGREPRSALDVSLRVGDTGVRLVATHLGLDAAERRIQIDRLARALEPPAGGGAPAMTVLAGDWNEWQRGSRRLAPLARRVGPFSRRATFPARVPLLPLDRIAVGPAASVLEVRAISTPAARTASDHLPLWARLRTGVTAAT